MDFLIYYINLTYIIGLSSYFVYFLEGYKEETKRTILIHTGLVLLAPLSILICISILIGAAMIEFSSLMSSKPNYKE